MIKKTILTVVILLVAIFGWLYTVGKGWLGGPWQPEAPVAGAAPAGGNRGHWHTTDTIWRFAHPYQLLP